MFVNPTREEVLGLVNLEALACGTPVVTFDAGGSPECIDKTCGCIVEYNNIDMIVERILWVYNEQPFGSGTCFRRAQLFNIGNKFLEYIKLYQTI